MSDSMTYEQFITNRNRIKLLQKQRGEHLAKIQVLIENFRAELATLNKVDVECREIAKSGNLFADLQTGWTNSVHEFFRELDKSPF